MTRGIALWAAGIGLIAATINLVDGWRWEMWAVQMATGSAAVTALVLYLLLLLTGKIDLPRTPRRPEDPAVRGRQRRAWSIAALGCGLAAVACVAASGLNPVLRVAGFVLLVFTALNTWRAWTLREREPARV
jgi:MFS family permease